VRFITLDISTPSSPRLLAKLNNVGGYDIFLDGPLAFVSGRGPWVENPQPFQILSIADSAHPAFIDSCRTTFDYPWAVWENAGLERAFVANRYGGLAAVDIHNLNNPVLDTAVLRTGSAVDVHVDGDLCYVAGETDGFRVLDVTDPTHPVYLSGLDTSLFTDAANYSLTARDSFAFVGWRKPFLRVVSVTDPLHPQMVGACSLFSWPRDMVLRDSLLYIGEDYRFQVVNVAQPREPKVVGSCGLPDRTFGMCIRDSLAYVANVEDVSVVDIAQPADPHILDTIGGYPNSIDVSDTFMFVVSDFWLSSYSVANPLQPRVLDSVYLSGGYAQDVLVLDSIAYCGGWVVQMVNVRDPGNLRVLTSTWTPPTFLHRLEFWEPYVYAACTEGGICVLETCALGVAEASHQPRRRGELSVRPNPSRTSVVISGESGDRFGTARILDVAGRTVLLKKGEGSCNIQLDVSRLPAGLYFVELIDRNETIGTCKFIRE
jgi:hypothetical protein